MYIHDDWRRLFQNVKKMTLEQFVEKMNRMHSNAWHKCWHQYEEAMGFALTPKQAEKLRAAHRKVVTEWDGMGMVELDLRELSEQEFIAVILENRRIGREKMIELVNKHCTNK